MKAFREAIEARDVSALEAMQAVLPDVMREMGLSSD